jgi:hypothetical protein
VSFFASVRRMISLAGQAFASGDARFWGLVPREESA